MARDYQRYREDWYPNYNKRQITVRSVAGCKGDEGVFVRYADGLLAFIDMDLFVHRAGERRFLPERSRLAITNKHIVFESESGEREAVETALIRSFYDYHVEFQLNTDSLDLGREWGDRVMRARSMRDWSQPELAERAHMSQPAISRIERGRHVPRPRTVDRLATALGMSPFEMAALGPRTLPPPFWGRVGRLRDPDDPKRHY